MIRQGGREWLLENGKKNTPATTLNFRIRKSGHGGVGRNPMVPYVPTGHHPTQTNNRNNQEAQTWAREDENQRQN